jgi:predicted RNA-binding Zn-ribbon protein involved in translation (DUF1610 family)
MDQHIISGGSTIHIPEGKEDFDLYCCNSCGRLITREDEKRAFSTGIVCPCGSVRYRPTKVVDAEPNADGDYVVTGRYGETAIIGRVLFEETYKPMEKHGP